MNKASNNLSTDTNNNRATDNLVESKDNITVVIPTLNEAEAIGKLIDEIKQCGYSNILVVDGYSEDGTAQIAREHGARVVQQYGRGKAGALSTARQFIETRRFILMDGDYSYDPKDLDRFLPFANQYHHIIGSRQRSSGNMSRTHRLGNWILTSLFNLLMGSKVPDVCSGMYMLSTDEAKKLMIDRPGFMVDLEIAAQTVLGGKTTTIPISYRKRIGTAKASTWRQGFSALWTVVLLARLYNPVLLFAGLASLALVPALVLLSWVAYVYALTGVIHSTYMVTALVLMVLGSQGLAVSTIAVLLYRVERRLAALITIG